MNKTDKRHDSPVSTREDSLRKRYFSKVAFSLLGLPASWALQALVPRALGPAEYGNFSFVTAFFTTIVNFFDGGTSTKLYNRLCQEPGDTGVLRFYWGLVGKAAAALFVLVALCSVLGFRERLWPEQPLFYVWLGALYSLGMWTLSVAGRVVDAYGLTVRGEGVRLLQKLVALLVVLALFIFSWLTLPSYFAVQFFTIGLLLFLWNLTIRRHGKALVPTAVSGHIPTRKYGREFWEFSHPLLVCGIIATLEGLADRWLLQYAGSSVEQGLYALSYQVSALCFVFSGAVVPLLAREFTQAHFAGDTARLAATFSVQVPRFFALSAYFGVFFASQADAVTLVFGGSQFAGATVPMLLMCLYPVHQTYGQLTASVFFASGETRLYRNIGLVGSLIGVICTYVALAPRGLGGLQLGSTGLALKMFGMQFVIVNVQLWFCTRMLHLSFPSFLANQFLVLGLLGLSAVIVRMGVSHFELPALVRLLVGATTYTVAVLAVIWIWPSAFQFTRSSLRSYIARGRDCLHVIVASRKSALT